MARDVFGVLRPAEPVLEKTIVVLGAPRGGTSMIAATLRKLGVMMGESLGHQHEDRSFRKDVPLREMVATVERRNATHKVWGWKLPNSVYYVEELLPVLRNPHFVAVFRNPYSISRSSAERDNREYTANLLQVAANHTKKVADLIDRLTNPTALVSFESAMEQPEEFVRGLASFVGVSPDDNRVQEAIDDAINPEMDYIKF
jgi:hypothetical protein